MAKEKFLVHKLNFGGVLDDVSTLDYLPLFSSTGILTFYIIRDKSLYVWIGKKTPQSLRNYIPKVRNILTEKHPEHTVLRYLTIDSGTEPSEFMSMLKITKEELNGQLQNIERKRFSIIDDIDQLKVKQSNLLMTGAFGEAVKVANEIIELSKEILDLSLENEQKEFIEKVQVTKENKDKVKIVTEETEMIKNKYVELIKNNENFSAHNVIETFKKKYGGLIKEFDIKSAVDLINKHSITWGEFKSNFDETMTNIKIQISQINNLISTDQKEDIVSKINVVRESISKLPKEEIKSGWVDELDDMNRNIRELEFKIESLEIINESNKLASNKSFDQAIYDLESFLDKLNETNFEEIKQEVTSVLNIVVNNKKSFDNREIKLHNLILSFKEHKDKHHLDSALMIVNKILEIAPLVGKDELIEEYTDLKNDLETEIKQLDQEREKGLKILLENAKNIEGSIEIEEDVLPFVESFKVEDILGDLPEDINEALEQISSLLIDYRVEIKEEINTRSILTSSLGEVVELEKELKVEKSKDEKMIKVSSGFENPFDDYIEDSLLTDIIPYNFEIESIQLNGEKVEELPDKTLTKEGVELNWQLKDIAPNEKVDLNYNLRRRVSRTIIYILEGQLKIIKTHTKLKTQELEGLYNAAMPFTNNLGSDIEGVVIEDIIPLYYIHFIKEPKALPNKVSSIESGNLVEWNVGTMINETKNYLYSLLDLYKYEEIKIQVDNLTKDGLVKLSEGDLTNSLNLFENVTKILKDCIK